MSCFQRFFIHRRGVRIVLFSLLIGTVVSLLAAQQAPDPEPGQEEAVAVADTGPDVIEYPSHVGKVTFPHQMHSEVMEMECVECHHEINAPVLDTPHPNYLERSDVSCVTCHHSQQGQPAQQRCSVCHDSEKVIPHHEMSSKVAVHTLCSGCHEIGTGQEASSSCSVCHSGPKSAW